MPSEIAYPFEKTPEFGGTMEVAAGVRWLRMPLPFRLDHINLWLLDDGDGWAIVDTDIKSKVTKQIWQTVQAEALDGRPVTRVIVTHFHPDHVGLAGWLARTLSVDLWMPRTEWLFARMLTLDTSDAFMDRIVEFYRRAGADAEFLARTRENGHQLPQIIEPLTHGIKRIRDGDELAIGDHVWRVVVGTGHAPEHACLHCPALGLLISGDQVLPRISPHVGVYPNEPDGNPLQDFIASIGTFLGLPEETLVLPSHNEPFTGLHVRLKELANHHDERLDTLRDLCAMPGHAADLAARLFNREFDHHQTGFAINETLSHLNLLLARGQVARHDGQDGVLVYERC